jgi:hypothetical protein
MLKEQGNPRLASLVSVLNTLGLRLSVEPNPTSNQRDEPATSARPSVTVLHFDPKRPRYLSMKSHVAAERSEQEFIDKWDTEPDTGGFSDETQLVEA